MPSTQRANLVTLANEPIQDNAAEDVRGMQVVRYAATGRTATPTRAAVASRAAISRRGL